MLKLHKRDSMIAKNPFPSPDSTCPSDSEHDIAQELEQKRLQLERDVAQFQAQKEKEFQDFEQQLRLSGKKENQPPTARISKTDRPGTKDRPKRASSSSVLELLAGHGTARSSAVGSLPSKTPQESQPRRKNPITSQAGQCPGKPTLSLEPLNIEGKTCPPSEAGGPSTPAILSRTLSQSSLSSTTSGSSTKSFVPSPQVGLQPLALVSTHSRDPFVGIITPSFLPLLGSGPSFHTSSASALVTPPVDEDEIRASHRGGLTGLPNGIIPLQSSSFPPHGAMLSAPNGTGKRAYTAPSASRMPSALRTTSASNLAKKRKHVTFRLADSAIVNPSSSYEEGPSPLGTEERPSKTKPATAVSHSSKKSAGLRYSTAGMRNGLIGDHTRSDEEDEAAGVKPGMSMDEVMQKLNEFNATLGDDEAMNFEFEDEDVGWTDTKYHEDDEDDEGDDDDDEKEDDHNQDGDGDAESSADEIPVPKVHEAEEGDSYFSPKFGETASIPDAESAAATGPFHLRDRSGSSPLTPVRDQDWNSLSSSDKDRLLFSRRTSDDSDSDHARRSHPNAARKARPPPYRAPSSSASLSGLKKTGSTNSLASLTSLAQLGTKQQKTPIAGMLKQPSSVLGARLSKQRNFEAGLGPSIDGGSGVGFFELDEELASPNARKVAPFALDPDAEADTEKDDDDDEKKERRSKSHANVDAATSGFQGASSVPIDIVRPSASVSSSWVGTFGH